MFARVEKNPEETIKWIKESMKQMYPHECYDKGIDFYQDNRVENKISYLYVEKAAENNYKEAHIQLSLMYLWGCGVEQNRDEAMKWIGLSDSRECYRQGMELYEVTIVDIHLYLETEYLAKCIIISA